MRDWIIRLAFATLVLDWIVLPWTTFVWLDIGAWIVIGLAMKIDVGDA